MKWLSALGDRHLSSDPVSIFNQPLVKSFYMFEPQFPLLSKLYLDYRAVRRLQHNNEYKVPGWMLYTEKVLRKREILSPSSLSAGLLCAWHSQGGGHKGENRAWVLSQGGGSLLDAQLQAVGSCHSTISVRT